MSRRLRPQPESIRLFCDILGLACISAAGFAVFLWPAFWLGLALSGVSLLVLSWRLQR